MKQSCTSTFRRSAAVGAALAVVTASSAFGIGATAATAATGAEGAPSTTTVTTGTTGTTGTTETGPGGTSAGPTTTPVDHAVAVPTVAPAAPAEATPGAAPTAPAAPAAPTDGTDAAQPAAPAVTPAPAPEAAPAAPAAAAPEDGSDLAFTEPSTEDEPLALTATAGTPFSHTFRTTGGNGTVGYAIRKAPSADWTVNVETGVLSATPTVVGTYEFQVVALSGSTQITEYVEVTVSPGAPVGVTYAVSTADHSGMWQVETDGTIWEHAIGQGRVRIVDSIPVADGATLQLAGLAVDTWGNRTTLGDDYPRSTATSSAASDRVVWDDRWSVNTVTFSGPGARTVTVAEGGVATSFTAVVPSASFGFTEQSSAKAPIALAATAGERFSHTFSVTDAPVPEAVRYELRGVRDGGSDHTSAPDGLDVTIDPESGVLSGTATAARSFPFQVVAVSGGQESVAHVELTVAPGAVARIASSVTFEDDLVVGGRQDRWTVDGDVITYHPIEGEPRRVEAIPARQGESAMMRHEPFDAYGNLAWTDTEFRFASDVASDRIDYDAESVSTWVTFVHASPHTVTVTYGDVTSDIRFEVAPAAASTAGLTTPTAPSGSLAYTGTDQSGPLTWALGLLTAGAGLLVHRLRRRRA
ncbi:hypothetical protein [Curtobacterium sp. MCBD17_032]|uniref:hypothetical protein n=1 Tax=Curtobacterium sp. MCBD17_032 TaxID=2175659 RepID=UPI000DAA71CC|nr:hypothetical protein [Curtobacterium sp. MCBD17_032]PZE80190.1 hypothetical protein DEI91_14540 [Curtobacterium sp. MCBD17_032]